MIIPSTASDVLDYVERSYPEARTLSLTPRADPHDVEATVVLVTPQDAARNVGVSVTFGTGRSATVLQHLAMPAPWPASADSATAVDLRATMPLSAQQVSSPLAFRVTGLARGVLHIDGNVWPIAGGRATPPLLLGAGNHAIGLRGQGRTGNALALEWRNGAAPWQPVPGQSLQSPDLPTGGLLGVYFGSSYLSGAPSFRRVDQFVNSYYQTPPGSLSFPFSVRWLGSLETKVGGPYAFSLDSAGPAVLSVDGHPVVDDGPSGGTRVGSVLLSAGMHALRIEYRATGSYLHCYVKWQPPGQSDFEPLPPSVTEPAHQ
jgi:hypothetical protein